MAVYKRIYQPYQGPRTPAWARFLIIARYAYAKAFESRFLIAYLVACAIWPAICAVLIYAPHNAGVVAWFEPARYFKPDGSFFLKFMTTQGTFAFFLAAFLGPGLVSTDLANNALPLYFCRPFSRAEYVLGKLSVLAILLSAITWVPGLLLWGLEASLEPLQWSLDHLWIARALFLGSWIWILTISLLALALSAWVKWRLAAGGLLFGIFFAAAGCGQALNHALGTKVGSLINLGEVIAAVWTGLFRSANNHPPVDPGAAWCVLLLACGACLYLLNRKVRAFEVERS